MPGQPRGDGEEAPGSAQPLHLSTQPPSRGEESPRVCPGARGSLPARAPLLQRAIPAKSNTCPLASTGQVIALWGAGDGRGVGTGTWGCKEKPDGRDLNCKIAECFLHPEWLWRLGRREVSAPSPLQVFHLFDFGRQLGVHHHHPLLSLTAFFSWAWTH